MKNKLKKVILPLNEDKVSELQIGDKIEIYGNIFTGRDVALPQLVKLIEQDRNPLNMKGAAIMHTAVSEAGISPTTSNKVEIAQSMPLLSKAGVKMHIGKGSLDKNTVKALIKYNSVFVVTPPAAALLASKILSKKVVAFPEEGMEAMHQLFVEGIPGIVVIAPGNSLN
jgi:fumarate hydratase subunit beta